MGQEVLPPAEALHFQAALLSFLLAAVISVKASCGVTLGCLLSFQSGILTYRLGALWAQKRPVDCSLHCWVICWALCWEKSRCCIFNLVSSSRQVLPTSALDSITRLPVLLREEWEKGSAPCFQWGGVPFVEGEENHAQ